MANVARGRDPEVVSGVGIHWHDMAAYMLLEDARVRGAGRIEEVTDHLSLEIEAIRQISAVETSNRDFRRLMHGSVEARQTSVGFTKRWPTA